MAISECALVGSGARSKGAVKRREKWDVIVPVQPISEIGDYVRESSAICFSRRIRVERSSGVKA